MIFYVFVLILCFTAFAPIVSYIMGFLFLFSTFMYTTVLKVLVVVLGKTVLSDVTYSLCVTV